MMLGEVSREVECGKVCHVQESVTGEEVSAWKEHD